MSRTLAISDLHGRSFSTKYYQLTSLYHPDNIVQLGDWFDTTSGAYTSQFQINNFEQMIKIRKKNPNVHILIGNHDAAYLFGEEAWYGIHCFGKEQEIKELIEENIKYIDYCFYDGKYLYSHAGITKTLLEELNIKDYNELNERLHNKDYKIFTDSRLGLLYKQFHKDWAKQNIDFQWNDLVNNKLDGKQVIGHYSSMGIQIKDDIYDIEDFNHSNGILFE